MSWRLTAHLHGPKGACFSVFKSTVLCWMVVAVTLELGTTSSLSFYSRRKDDCQINTEGCVDSFIVESIKN